MEKWFKMKLHLGCGDKIIPNFTNVDIRPMSGVDLVEDVGKLTKINNIEINLVIRV